MIYGLGAFNIPALILFCLAVQVLRAKNLSWHFLYAWSVFGLSIVFIELVRFSILVVMKTAPIDIIPFVYIMALNIVIFPLVYVLLPRAQRRV